MTFKRAQCMSIVVFVAVMKTLTMRILSVAALRSHTFPSMTSVHGASVGHGCRTRSCFLAVGGTSSVAACSVTRVIEYMNSSLCSTLVIVVAFLQVAVFMPLETAPLNFVRVPLVVSGCRGLLGIPLGNGNTRPTDVLLPER